LVIHQFGTTTTSPWHFPTLWLYVLAGCRKILELLHQGAGYHVILPQDGLFTAAFSALAAKLAGGRVVCIDHSTLTWVGSRAFRAEYTATLAKKHWHWTLRLLDRLLIVLYWPSLYLLARISAFLVDHFLIPGVAGDGIEEICKRLRVPTSRITRYSSMVNMHRHVLPEAATRAARREEKSIPVDAIVVAIICRLAPEKGLDIAIESISRALAILPPELRVRVRVVIAGEGPLRRQVEEDISIRGLSSNCVLWGDIPTKDVLSLLAISDIFLYTSTRGGCFAMAVLEAMASRCAVIASTKPLSNASLLAEGRGIAVPPGDAEQTAMALVRLVSNLELCRHMGHLASNYIAMHHSPTEFRRTLMRATYWSALDEILASRRKLETIKTGSESLQWHH
jgi:glycosyltransferase involved in cell wall biosynthesis